MNSLSVVVKSYQKDIALSVAMLFYNCICDLLLLLLSHPPFYNTLPHYTNTNNNITAIATLIFITLTAITCLPTYLHLTSSIYEHCRVISRFFFFFFCFIFLFDFVCLLKIRVKSLFLTVFINCINVWNGTGQKLTIPEVTSFLSLLSRHGDYLFFLSF